MYGNLALFLILRLDLLCRMAQEGVSYDLMRRLSDVSEPFLVAFCAAYSTGNIQTLMAQVRQASHGTGLEDIKDQLLSALIHFGIAEEVSKSYLEGLAGR